MTKTKRIVFSALLCIVALAAIAQTAIPMQSATWRGPEIACGTGLNGADLMPLNGQYPGQWETQNAPPNAGVWPAGYNLTVRKVCLMHGGSFTGPSYAVVGHSGPNGDLVTPWVGRSGDSQCMSYEKDAAIVVTGGEYFDVHAGCASGSHFVVMQIWYTRP